MRRVFGIDESCRPGADLDSVQPGRQAWKTVSPGVDLKQLIESRVSPVRVLRVFGGPGLLLVQSGVLFRDAWSKLLPTIQAKNLDLDVETNRNLEAEISRDRDTEDNWNVDIEVSRHSRNVGSGFRPKLVELDRFPLTQSSLPFFTPFPSLAKSSADPAFFPFGQELTHLASHVYLSFPFAYLFLISRVFDDEPLTGQDEKMGKQGVT
ncbi:hypothetical protein WN48_05998 [Eufriesea mexicana]|nr:hypothetical protein WN48_05998 [Eufriesea mexicana]